MMKTIVSGFVVTMILVSVFTIAFSMQPAAAPTTITVPDDFPTIQEAIAVASAGDTIFVKAGIHYEHLVITKKLSIIGESRYNTIIDGLQQQYTVRIESDNVTLNKFTVRNGSDAGVIIGYDADRNYVEISDCKIVGNALRGIIIFGANNTIENNEISGNGGAWAFFGDQCGILVVSPREGGHFLICSNRIVNNNVTNNSYHGIYTHGSDGNFILDNNVWGNEHSGISLDYGTDGPTHQDSVRNVVENNTVWNNFNGIISALTQMAVLRGNNVYNNTNYGIGLETCFFNTVERNNMSDNGFNFGVWTEGITNCFYHNITSSNTVNGKAVYYFVNETDLSLNPITLPNAGYVGLINCSRIEVNNLTLTCNREGILIVDTQNSTFYHSTFANNEFGVWMLWYDWEPYPQKDESNNKFHHNNILDNFHSVGTAYGDPYMSINEWDDNYPSGGNYWSDYQGIDVFRGINQDLPGSDGLGDEEYMLDDTNIDHYPLISLYPSPPQSLHNLTMTSSEGGITYPSAGTYSYTVGSVVPVSATPHEYYAFDYWELDGIPSSTTPEFNVTMDTHHSLHAVFTYVGLHDMAIVDVSPELDLVRVGDSINISISIENHGTFTEACNLTVYADMNTGILGDEVVMGSRNPTLAAGSQANLTVAWNTTSIPKGTYRVSAIVEPVPGETSVADNTYMNGDVQVLEIIDVVVKGANATIMSNVTLTQVVVRKNTLHFQASGPDGAMGWVNVTFPMINTTNIKVFSQPPLDPAFPVITMNGTHYFIYFEFTLSTHEVLVIFADVDITVTDIAPRKLIVGEGCPCSFNVTLRNQGDNEETFNVTLLGNGDLLGILWNMTLPSGSTSTVTFNWNQTTFLKGNYSISANVTTILLGELDTSNNNLTDGWLFVTLPGDVDGNRTVDIFDIVRMATIYGVVEPDPAYDSNCDVDDDGDIDIFDIVAAASHYGESW